METIFYIILASLFVSLISLSGAVLFIIKEKKIQDYTILFVALAAGSLLGGAFFHLIPESFDNFLELGGQSSSIPAYFILVGILFFYVIEKFVHWHHHHDLNCHHHSLSTLSLIGDGFHNFIDGILIAAAFLVDIKLGFVTTLLIVFHEIPQEIGDLAILLHSGYSKYKALIFNFLSGCFSILGALFSYFILETMQNILPLIIAFTAGGFIYIALADIIPELHKKNINILLINLFLILGLVLSFLFTFIM